MLGALSLLLHLPGWRGEVFNPDEAYVSVQARVLVRGGHLYQDVVDRKPPGLPYLTAAVQAVLGHPSLRAMRLLDAVAQAGIALLLAALVRRRIGRRGSLAIPALYLLAVAALPAHDAQAFTSETYVALFSIGALWLIETKRLLAAGLALGAACLMRQTAVLFVPALAYAAYRLGRGRAVLAVATTAAALVVVAAMATGWRDFWSWNLARGADGYLTPHGDFRFAAGAALRTIQVVGTAAAGCLVLIPSALQRPRHQIDAWLGVAGGLVAMALGLRFFPHYALQLLPWLALAAAAGWGAIGPGVAARSVLAGAVLLAALQVGIGLSSPAGTTPRPDALVAAIEQRSAPGDPIFVWGNGPELYLWSGRDPSPRFITSSFLTGYAPGRRSGPDPHNRPTPGAWAAFRHDLRNDPPVLVIDLAETGFRNGRAQPIEAYPIIARELAKNYRPVEVVDGATIYERRDHLLDPVEPSDDAKPPPG